MQNIIKVLITSITNIIILPLIVSEHFVQWITS